MLPPPPKTRILTLIAMSIAVMLMSLTQFHTLQVSQSKYLLREDYTRASSFFDVPFVNVTFPHVHENTAPTSFLDYCFSFNSQAWLDADRVGNLQDPRMDDEFILQTIINSNSLLNPRENGTTAKSILRRTLCHKDSTFLSLEAATTSSTDVSSPSNATIHDWSLRLIYLAAHVHQHLPAVDEAKLRLQQGDHCQAQFTSKRIGPFDYECATAKFLVVSMGRLGLGAVMRLGVVNALIAGMASNRTVLVINDSPVGPKFVREPWLLASCPRRDMQCFYMPMSPCVLPQQEISNGTVLERGQARALFKSGTLPEHLDDERVLLLDIVLRPQRTPYAFRENTVRIIHNHVLDPLHQRSQGSHPLLPLLTKATNFILQEEQLENGSYYYFGHNTKHNHALVYYAMRPNMEYHQRLQQMVQDNIPQDLQPDMTFGVPIRDSDKCDMESECMPFERYMNMTRYTWSKYHSKMEQSSLEMQDKDPSSITNIIVTSEAADVHTAMEQYQMQGRHQHDFPFVARFVANRYDRHQGTGNPGRTTANISMDEVMLSAVSSLQLQLHARYTMGNCCSNFHLLLFDFLRDGCGAAKHPIAQCLQDHEDPAFRLCCHWSKTEECMAKKRQQQQ